MHTSNIGAGVHWIFTGLLSGSVRCCAGLKVYPYLECGFQLLVSIFGSVDFSTSAVRPGDLRCCDVDGEGFFLTHTAKQLNVSMQTTLGIRLWFWKIVTWLWFLVKAQLRLSYFKHVSVSRSRRHTSSYLYARAYMYQDTKIPTAGICMRGR
jgi:hypothetical protein